MTREEAVEVYHGLINEKIKAAFEFFAPELAESEDERVRTRLIEYFQGFLKGYEDCYKDGGSVKWEGLDVKSIIAWLEKQKENPKSCDSIPSDCASDAKCEDRWHKVADSLPDNPREVLCKDEAGNYFIGRYYVGEGWDISNYDDEDKPHHLNPPVSKWIDFPSEKQKEQKPNSIMKYVCSKEDKRFIQDCANVLIANDYIASAERLLSMFDEQKPAEIAPNQFDGITYGMQGYSTEKPAEWSEEDTEMYINVASSLRGYACGLENEEHKKHIKNELDWLENRFNSLRPQPKQEWSEEDEKMLNRIINDYENGDKYWFKAQCSTPFRLKIDWLKSLRPQPKWKPSEEQMAVLKSVKDYVAQISGYWGQKLHSLLNDLIKLTDESTR